MRYALMIYGAEPDTQPSDAEMAEMMAAYRAFDDEVTASGVKQGGEALQPVSTATTVRVRDGEVLTTDGPFAETKEQLGGFYLVDCEDLDEALEIAAKIPGAHYGSIEVRPIWQVPEA